MNDSIRLEPILIRPGARFECGGDGLCCTDIHGLGPISKTELRVLRKIDRDGAGYDDDFEDVMLRTESDGGCHFLMADQRCRVHAEFGPETKPLGCRQFPFFVTATPEGARVGTYHRCPCRSLGKRPELTVEAALPSIADVRGKPLVNFSVEEIRLEKKKTISFEEWRAIEAPLLAELNRGRIPEIFLEVEAFPALKRRGSYVRFAKDLIAARDGTRFGAALAWVGDSILNLLGERPSRPPHRPWADAFDRAELRGRATKPERTIADFIADELWSLRWAEKYSFLRFRADLATRLAIIKDIEARLREQGARRDRAAAEAISIMESIAESEHWSELVPMMRLAGEAGGRRAESAAPDEDESLEHDLEDEFEIEITALI